MVTHIYTSSNVAPFNAPSDLEGDWIADILRVWNEDKRAWEIRDPLLIRLEQSDLVVSADANRMLCWSTSPACSPECSAGLPPTKKEPTSKPSESAKKRSRTTYEFIRFPALSQAVGSRVKKASAKSHPKKSKDGIAVLELSTDSDTVLRFSVLHDGTLLARVSPAFEAPDRAPLPPEPAFLTADQ